jgi:nucleoside-diphosphate-sugar epimerase
MHPRPVSPNRVLILGKNGFISIYLQKWCIEKKIPFKVIGSEEIDLTSPKSVDSLIRIVKPDDFIIMTSALPPGITGKIEMFMRNIQMAENLSKLINKIELGHFIYLSSEAVYSAEKLPIDEDSSREPVSIYALMHTAREMIFSNVFKGREESFCILRLASVFGHGDTHNQYGPNQFVRSALNDGNIVLYGKGEERRNFISIKDVTNLIGLVILLKSYGVINLVSNKSISYKKVAKIVTENLPNNIQIKFIPRTIPVIHKPYKKSQVFRFIYNLGRPINSIVHRIYDNGLIKKSFPSFTYTPIEKAIINFLDLENKECG